MLEEENQDKLNEVILDKEIVDWMVQNLEENIFSSDDFDEVNEVVKNLCKYNQEPNFKLCPFSTMSLLNGFQENSLTKGQICQILDMNNDNYTVDKKLQIYNMDEIWHKFLLLKDDQVIPEKLLYLICQTVDFKLNQVDISNDDQIQLLYSIVDRVMKYCEKNSAIDVSSYIKVNILENNNIDNECDAIYIEFLKKIVSSIPNGRAYLRALISPTDNEKDLAKMLNPKGNNLDLNVEHTDEIFLDDSKLQTSQKFPQEQLKMEKANEMDLINNVPNVKTKEIQKIEWFDILTDTTKNKNENNNIIAKESDLHYERSKVKTNNEVLKTRQAVKAVKFDIKNTTIKKENEENELLENKITEQEQQINNLKEKENNLINESSNDHNIEALTNQNKELGSVHIKEI